MNGGATKTLRYKYRCLLAASTGPSPSWRKFKRVVLMARRDPAPVIKKTPERRNRPRRSRPMRSLSPNYGPVIVLRPNRGNPKYWDKATLERWRRKVSQWSLKFNTSIAQLLKDRIK